MTPIYSDKWGTLTDKVKPTQFYFFFPLVVYQYAPKPIITKSTTARKSNCVASPLPVGVVSVPVPSSVLAVAVTCIVFAFSTDSPLPPVRDWWHVRFAQGARIDN
jgi:hypothetical protein